MQPWKKSVVCRGHVSRAMSARLAVSRQDTLALSATRPSTIKVASWQKKPPEDSLDNEAFQRLWTRDSILESPQSVKGSKPLARHESEKYDETEG
jgi:hypothetical protein